MSPIAAAVFLLSSRTVVLAFPDGAGSCEAGNVLKDEPNEHNAKQYIFTGDLEDNGFTVFLDGEPLVPTKPGNMGIVCSPGTDHTLELVSTAPHSTSGEEDGTCFRGFLMRVEAGQVDTSNSFRPINGDDKTQISDRCQDLNVGGITHTDNNVKEGVAGLLNVDANVEEYILDVTVVIRNRNTISEWYYSRYLLTTRPPEPTPMPVPTASPTSAVTPEPSPVPTPEATSEPTIVPSSRPSPGDDPDEEMPSSPPSYSPTNFPTEFPTRSPTLAPTFTTGSPSVEPSEAPSNVSRPSRAPSDEPSSSPSAKPSVTPTTVPIVSPSQQPQPSNQPTESSLPSILPSESIIPSVLPSDSPTGVPSTSPTETPVPSDSPSISAAPSGEEVSRSPSDLPSGMPSVIPTETPAPSIAPTETVVPSILPSLSTAPSGIASSQAPSASLAPSASPSESSIPSGFPTVSVGPTFSPSDQPSLSTVPSVLPSAPPSSKPSGAPSISSNPSDAPSEEPSASIKPSILPSQEPTVSAVPSTSPSQEPSLSKTPSKNPSASPSRSFAPSPSLKPSAFPTVQRDLFPPGFSSAPSLNCIANLVEIEVKESSPKTDINEERLYFLCPNTVFFVDLQAPISPRSNAKIYCGYSGSIDDNCIISGGDIQVLFPDRDKIVSNVLFKGVSFARARGYNVLFSQPGDVQFMDCAFMDNHNVRNALVNYTTATFSPTSSPAPSTSLYPSFKPSTSSAPTFSSVPSTTSSPTLVPTRSSFPTLAPTRSLSPSNLPSKSPSLSPTANTSSAPSSSPTSSPTNIPSAVPSSSRSPSTSAVPSLRPSVTTSPTRSPAPSFSPSEFLPLTSLELNVTFLDCMFRNNSSIDPDGGLIENEGSSLSVAGTFFVDSHEVDFIIGNLGGFGSIYLTGNCFVNNVVDVAPIVNLDGGSFESSRNSGTANETQVCEYLADYQEQQISCVDFEMEDCMLTESPSATPSVTPIPSSAPTDTCFSDLEDIVNAEYSSDVDVTQQRIYRLCSNTVFEVDSRAAFFPRPNAHFICGDDGSSNNGCVVSGGNLQVVASFVDGTVSNVVFQGISFVGSRQYNVALLIDGDFLFVDCEFRDNNGIANALLSYEAPVFGIPSNRRQRVLKESIDLGSNRFLQNTTVDGNSVLNVTFEDCVFRNNSSVEPFGSLIENEGGELSVRDSFFVDNKNLDSIISNFGGQSMMNLSRNCFVENLVGIAQVQNKEGGTFESLLNSGTESDSLTVICEFLADFQNQTVSCVEFESDECSLTTSPTSPPSISPSTYPTATASPTLFPSSALPTSAPFVSTPSPSGPNNIFQRLQNKRL